MDASLQAAIGKDDIITAFDLIFISLNEIQVINKIAFRVELVLTDPVSGNEPVPGSEFTVNRITCIPTVKQAIEII